MLEILSWTLLKWVLYCLFYLHKKGMIFGTRFTDFLNEWKRGKRTHSWSKMLVRVKIGTSVSPTPWRHGGWLGWADQPVLQDSDATGMLILLPSPLEDRLWTESVKNGMTTWMAIEMLLDHNTRLCKSEKRTATLFKMSTATVTKMLTIWPRRTS